MIFRNLAQARQIRFTTRFDRLLERACHQRNIAGGSDGRISHHRVRAHFHGFRSLARTANTSVDDHRNIGILNDHFNEIACTQALIRADHRAQWHHASRTRVLKTLRRDRIGEHVRHDHEAFFCQLFRGFDGFLIVRQQILRLMFDFHLHKIRLADFARETGNAHRLFGIACAGRVRQHGNALRNVVE